MNDFPKLEDFCDEEGYLKEEAFRKLDSKEEQEFRQWARENPNHENRKDPKLCHPVVRDEWKKMDNELDEQVPFEYRGMCGG